MKNTLTALLLLLCPVLGAQTTFNYETDHAKVTERTKDANDALYFATQLKRFKQNDATQTDFEVLSMLLSFSQNPDYAPMKDAFRETVAKELIDTKQYEQAVMIADKLLKTSPLNVKSLYQKAFAFEKLGQKDSAAVYNKQWRKILKAMFLSGKGTAMANPIFSLGPDDGGVFIGAFIGAKVLQRKIEKNSKGESVAVYDAQRGNKKTTLYFLVDHAIKRIEEEERSK